MAKGRIIRGRTPRIPARLRAPRGSSMVTMPASRAVAARQIPILYRPPTILGTAAVGEMLYAVGYAFTNAPDAYAFQWRRDGAIIDGATNAAYEVVTADAGRQIDYAVVASSGDQDSAPAISVAVTVAGVAVDPNPIIPASQSVAFERLTRVGHGGHALGYLGTGFLSLTGAAAAKFKIDDINHLVPGAAVSTYGADATLTAGTLTGTITEYSDAARLIPTGVTGAVSVVTNAGDNYSVTWKPTGSTNASTTSANQIQTALQLATTLGQHIVIRDGAVINPTGLDMRLRPGATAYNASVVNQRIADFNGTNFTVIRPETPLGAKIRRIQLDGNSLGTHRVDFIHFSGVHFQLRQSDMAPVVTTSDTFMLSVGTSCADNCKVSDCEFEGASDSLYGMDLASAIQGNKSSRWQIVDNHIHHVAKGVYLANPTNLRDPVTMANLATAAGDHSDSTLIYHEVRRNLIHDVGLDEINISCASGAQITDNVLWNKVTAVKPILLYPTVLSPYDTATGKQPHGDGCALDYSFCVFGSVDGSTITGNRWLRGIGRDTMPFYTVADYGTFPGGVDSQGYVPDPLAPYPDSQGIFITNGTAGKPARPGGYTCRNIGTVIKGNMFMRVFVNGISVECGEDVIIENNTVIGEKSVTLQSGDSASAGIIKLTTTTGTANRVAKNICTNGATLMSNIDLETGAALAAINDNVDVNWADTVGAAAHASVFVSPAYGSSNITDAHCRANFAGKPASAADLGGGAWAGAFKSDGTNAWAA